MEQTKENRLIEAATVGDLECVELLIKEGVKVNCKDEDDQSLGFGWTPLHYCAFKGGTTQDDKYTAIAKLLLNNGALPEERNNTQLPEEDYPDGETPTLFAVRYFALDILDVLIEFGAKIHPGNNETILMGVILTTYNQEAILDEDIGNEQDIDTKKAVRKAEGKSYARMIKRIDAIVKNGFDLNLGKYSAVLSVITQVSKSNIPVEVLFYLFNKGANPRACLIYKGTTIPLFFVACDSKLPLSTLLEMANLIGPDYVLEKSENFTPLLIAIRIGNLQLVKKLIDQGADFHRQNDRAVRIAAQNGHIDIVEYLVQIGSDINCVNSSGMNAIQLAEKERFSEIVAFLKSKM